MDESAAANLEAPLGDLYKISRAIADTVSDAIITIDEESTMLFANRAAEKIFGYSRAELLGQSLTMLMPDYLRHVHRAGMQRYVTTGQPHITWEAVELSGRHQSGREIPVSKPVDPAELVIMVNGLLQKNSGSAELILIARACFQQGC